MPLPNSRTLKMLRLSRQGKSTESNLRTSASPEKENKYPNDNTRSITLSPPKNKCESLNFTIKEPSKLTSAKEDVNRPVLERQSTCSWESSSSDDGDFSPASDDDQDYVPSESDSNEDEVPAKRAKQIFQHLKITGSDPQTDFSNLQQLSAKSSSRSSLTEREDSAKSLSVKRVHPNTKPQYLSSSISSSDSDSISDDEDSEQSSSVKRGDSNIKSRPSSSSRSSSCSEQTSESSKEIASIMRDSKTESQVNMSSNLRSPSVSSESVLDDGVSSLKANSKVVSATPGLSGIMLPPIQPRVSKPPSNLSDSSSEEDIPSLPKLKEPSNVSPPSSKSESRNLGRKCSPIKHNVASDLNQNRTTDQNSVTIVSFLHSDLYLSESSTNEDTDTTPTMNSDSPCNNSPQRIMSPYSPSILTQYQEPIRRRRRHSNKKIIIKTLRNSGLKYTSTKGKLVEARIMGRPCGDHCRLKCSEKINEVQRKKIFGDYWAMGLLSRQRDFINSHMTSIQPKHQCKEKENTRKPKHAFYLEIDCQKIRVCKMFFKSTLGINDRPIRTVIEKKQGNGMLEPEKRGKLNASNHGQISAALLAEVRNHINSIPRIESHYLRKQTSREFIDGGKNLVDLYNDYVEECMKKDLKFVKIHTYRLIFKNEFKISFFTPKKDQCELCASYKNSANKASLQEKYLTHLIEKEEARKEKSADKELCSPKYIVATYDLQAVLPVPRGDVSVFYYKSKLNCYNFTVYELGTKDVECYFWNEVEGQRGANEICTCVLKYIQQKAGDAEQDLDIIFYSDNCCGQQKNQFMIAMYIYALKTIPTVKSITHKFLITGHTQNEGDSAHSAIEKEIKKVLKSGPIYVPDQYVTAIRNAKKKGKKYTVHEMCHSEFYNIKKLVDGKLGIKISEVKVIKIERNDDNTIRCFYKTSYLQDFRELPAQHTNTRASGRAQRPYPQQLKPLYAAKLPLGERKKSDIRSLINANHIPRYYASSFYNGIV